MPKLKNPFAAAAALAERLSNPDTPLSFSRRRVTERTESSDAASREEDAPVSDETAPASPEEAVSPGLHQPKILREIVIPMLDDEVPETVRVNSFSPEEEEPAESAAEGAEETPSPEETPRRKLRRARTPLTDELRSNLWALSILLGVACTVVAFFFGAFA